MAAAAAIQQPNTEDVTCTLILVVLSGGNTAGHRG